MIRHLSITFLFIFCAVSSSCKDPAGSSAPSGEESCNARGDGYTWTGSSCIQSEKDALTESECAKISGASWDSAKHKCSTPSTNSDCKKSGDSLVWNGKACAKNDALKNFYQLCIDKSSSAQVRHTIAVLSKPYFLGDKTPSCQKVFDGLYKQTTLVIQNEEIQSLEPLQGLDQLQTLDIWNNKVTDLTPLNQLKTLSVLKAGHNKISDLSPLSNMTELKELYIFENQISDLSPLKDLDGLIYLDFSYNQVKDTSVLNKEKFTQGFFSEGNPVNP